MRQFLRYLFVVAAVLMVAVGDVWGECYVISESQIRIAYSSNNANESGTYSGSYALDGPCYMMTFSYRLDANSDATYWHKFTIEGRKNGGAWTEIYNSGEIWNAGSKPVSKDISKYANSIDEIRFKRTARKGWTAASAGTKDVLINNFKITRVESISPQTASHTFSPITVGEATPTHDFTFDYSNVGTNFVVSSKNSSPHFSISYISPAAPDACVGSATYRVTYNPQFGGSHDEIYTITCKDGNTLKGTVTISVAGSAKGYPQHTWYGKDIYKVDDAAIDLDEVWDSNNDESNTISYSIADNGFTPSGKNNEGAVAPYIDGDNKLHLGQAGTLRLVMNQKATDGFYEKTSYKTIEIEKHTPVFTLKPDPLYFNKEYPDYFHTTANTQLDITSSDTLVAKWVQGSNAQSYTLKTFSKTNVATLTAIQHENYYWAPLEGSVDIQLQNARNHVPLKIESEADMRALWVSNTHNLTWDNGVDLQGGNYEDKFYVFKFEGYPKEITFNYAVNSGGVTGYSWSVEQSNENGNWGNKQRWSSGSYDGSGSLTLDKDTRYIRFCYSGNGHGKFYDINVSRLEEFYAAKENTTTPITELNFNKDLEGNPKDNKVNKDYSLTFDLKYANIGHNVELTTSHPDYFTISEENIKDVGGEQEGRRKVTVTFVSSRAYSTDETPEQEELYIYDELGNNDTLKLIATATLKDQNITWNNKYADGKLAINQEVYDAATTDLEGGLITYGTSDADIIQIIDDGKAFKAVAPGVATITASQAGNIEWKPASSTKEFTVTEKQIQYIHWVDNLTHLKVGAAPITLTATAQVLLNVETGETMDMPERTPLIAYESANPNIVSIEGNVLTIVGEGETTVTAILPGDDVEYEEATLTMPVRVLLPSNKCESYVLEATSEFSLEYSVVGSERIYEPAAFTGPGHILTFEARKNNSTAVGNIIIQQYVNGTWQTIDDANPGTDWRSYYYVLDRNATKIRFYNNYGSYKRYFKNVLVTQLAYLETTTSSITVEQSIVAEEISREIAIQYSDIPAGVLISHKNDKIQLSANQLDSDCGKHGEQILRMLVVPSEKGEIIDTIKIYDDITNSSIVIPIYIATQQVAQNLQWTAPTTDITSCSDLDLPTHTNVDLSITWSVSAGKHLADFDSNGNLLIYGTGTVTLKASNEGNNIYEPFEKTYTINVVFNPIFLGSEDSDWTNPANWNVCNLPRETDKVTLQAPVVFDTPVSIGGLVVESNASIHIKSTGGLTVGVSGIVGAKEDGSSIIIDNSPAGAGFLKVNPTSVNKPARVTVNYSTEAYNSGNPRDEVWQYMGAPGKDMAMSDTEKTTIYHWDEVKGWVKQSGASLTPFVGYAFTQNKADSATFTVTATPIIPTEVQEIELTVTPTGMGGSNLFVNSFLAPIDLAKFDGTEFEGKVDQTFYLFNSGSWKDWQGEGGSNQMNYGVSPGQYYALSPKGASLMDKEYDQTTIPSMQGVYVIAREKGAKIKLDYSKHVFDAAASNRPMRAPQRISEDFKRVRLQVNSQNSGADRMYVIQHEAGTAGYDNGYDARNMAVNGQVAIYTHELDGQMEISVSDKIDSTYIGFRAGSDSEYTLRMTSVVGEEMYLKDLVDNILIPVVDGQDYSFSATPNSVNDTRFLLLGQKSGVATDIETVQLYIHDNMVHVMQAPQNSTISIYTVGGVAVANYSIGYAPCTIDLFDLSTGVYVLRINNKAYKFVCK